MRNIPEDLKLHQHRCEELKTQDLLQRFKNKIIYR
jgi:hypothetical protein